MIIHNQSNQEICVGGTLKGAPAHPKLMMLPGERLVIEDIMPELTVEFVTTIDGLRVAFKEQKKALLWGPNGTAIR